MVNMQFLNQLTFLEHHSIHLQKWIFKSINVNLQIF